ncbi:MAG: sulfotransferase family protein [Chloroflexota bacterium]
MLKLIGVGFGRTGTTSLKAALDILGMTPCHHMIELFNNEPLIQKWYDVAFNGYRDWDTVFEGYQATVDWPSTTYWRELADYYPQAKLLLTVRDTENWYKSMTKTLLPVMHRPIEETGSGRLHSLMARKLILNDTFNGAALSDPEATMGVFEQHNADVEAAFGADRLLVWRVKDGWKPLCDFLELPVPDSPFPRLNTTSQFLDSMKDS